MLATADPVTSAEYLYDYAGDDPINDVDPSGGSVVICTLRNKNGKAPKGCPASFTHPGESHVWATLLDFGSGCYAGGRLGAWAGDIPNPWVEFSVPTGAVLGCVGGGIAAILGGDQAIPDRPEKK